MMTIDNHVENRREAPTIILAFSSLGVNSVDKDFEFSGLLQRKDCAAIILRDTTSSWYQPIDDCRSDDILPFLQSRVKGYDRIVCIGYSMGGYAALKYGRLLNAQHVLAFAPQTVLSTHALAAMGDNRWEQYLPRVRQIIGDSDHLDLAPDINSDGAAIFVAEHGNQLDLEHANRFAGSARIIAVGSGPIEHGALIVAFRESNLLRQLIDATIADTPLPDVRGLFASWERAHDHRIEITQVSGSATAVTVRGFIRVTSATDIYLSHLRNHPVRLGARLYRPGSADWIEEQRFDFSSDYLRSGHSYPFSIEIPWRADDLAAAQLKIALVCEGRFWFDDLGLGQAVLSLSGQARLRLCASDAHQRFESLPAGQAGECSSH